MNRSRFISPPYLPINKGLNHLLSFHRQQNPTFFPPWHHPTNISKHTKSLDQEKQKGNCFSIIPSIAGNQARIGLNSKKVVLGGNAAPLTTSWYLDLPWKVFVKLNQNYFKYWESNAVQVWGCLSQLFGPSSHTRVTSFRKWKKWNQRPIIAQLSPTLTGFFSSFCTDTSGYLRAKLQPKKGQDLVIAFASGNFAMVLRIFFKSLQSF